jgi:hypothetical protein
MVRTVSRSSVAKWPDIGATTSTRGCASCSPPSFLKRSSVQNGVTCTSSSCTKTSLADAPAPSITLRIPKSGRRCVTCALAKTVQAAPSRRAEGSSAIHGCRMAFRVASV